MAQRGIRGLVAILIFASLSLLGVAGPGATSIITPVEGSLDASLVVRVSTVTPLLLDVSGTATFMVSGPGLVGLVLTTEMFGFPFDLTLAPFPNISLLALKNPGFDQSAILTFDPTRFELDGVALTVPADFWLPGKLDGSKLTVPATGVPVGTVSDPALLAFLGPLLFSFTFEFLIHDPDGVFKDLDLLDFDLVSVTQVPVTRVPAPGSLILLALGALAPSLRHLRHRP